MRFTRLNPFQPAHWKLSAAALFAFLVLGCGALTAFVLAPRQALLAWRMSRIPPMDAAAVETLAPVEDVLLTGVLEGNPSLAHHFVAYTLERWEAKDANRPSDGRWVDAERVFPDLQLVVQGQPVLVQSSAEVRLLGAVHVGVYQGNTGFQDALHRTRYHGLRNGDQVTVLGRKAASGGVVPSYLFAGNRAAFEAFARSSARDLFLAGLLVMAFSPLVFGFASAVTRWA